MLELLSLQMNTIIMKIRGCLRELRKVSLRQTDEGLPFLFYNKNCKKIKNFELRKKFFYIITVKPKQKVYKKEGQCLKGWLHGSVGKRLRRLPFKEETRVQLPAELKLRFLTVRLRGKILDCMSAV